MEINQASGDQSVRGATHYDIKMGNDIARYAHCDITMANDVTRNIHCDITVGNGVTRNIHCDVTMSNNIAMCTYGIIMHNDIAINVFHYYIHIMHIYVILLWIV